MLEVPDGKSSRREEELRTQPARASDIMVPREFRGKIEHLIRDNIDVVAESDRELSQPETVKMRIDTGDHPPIKLRLYRTPLHKRKVVEEAVRDMQKTQELNYFVQQFFQLMMITNKVRQTSQSLTILLEHVRAQLDMLSLGHLSPSIVTPGHLRDLLLRVQTELPHHLRLPVDPTEGLWK